MTRMPDAAGAQLLLQDLIDEQRQLLAPQHGAVLANRDLPGLAAACVDGTALLGLV
jgi:hypothetical protein